MGTGCMGAYIHLIVVGCLKDEVFLPGRDEFIAQADDGARGVRSGTSGSKVNALWTLANARGVHPGRRGAWSMLFGF